MLASLANAESLEIQGMPEKLQASVLAEAFF